jgi:hypothetical protein
MIRALPKPLPRPIVPHPKPQRLPKGRNMTLIAAFRARNYGILLCADREEDDYGNGSRKEVDKIYNILLVRETDDKPKQICEFFIAGSGPSKAIGDVSAAIHSSLAVAAKSKEDIASTYEERIKIELEAVHKKEKKSLKYCPLNLLIVAALHEQNQIPRLYRTAEAVLYPVDYYASVGNGKPISDYLAARLYVHGLPTPQLCSLAAFIFRETEYSRGGVGMGVDMLLIHESNRARRHFGPLFVKEMDAGVPALQDAVYSYWSDHLKLPDWLSKE